MTAASLAGQPGVVGSAPTLTHVGVRSRRCSPPPSADLASSAASGPDIDVDQVSSSVR